MGDTRLNPLQQLVAGRIIRAAQRIGESEFVGGAVALEHQTAQAQQRSTVVATVIHSLFERN